MNSGKPMNITLARRVAGKPYTHEMVVIHRIFRREIRLLADLVRRVPADDVRRAEEIAGHAEFILTAVRHHHSAEDELLWPALLDRTQPEAGLVRRMEAQHEAVAEHSGNAERLLAEWRHAPLATLGDELATTLTDLSAALIQHLDKEEAEVLPLVREHLTVALWEEVGQRAFDKFPRSALPVMLGQVLEDAAPADRELFLSKLPPPVRLTWRLFGQRRYTRHIRMVRGQLSLNPLIKTAARASSAVHVGLYRRSGGRVGGTIKGTTVLLLTVPGRKTGRDYTVPVSYFKVADGYLVAGSAGGTKVDPQWIRNVAAARRARIQIGGQRHEVEARIAERPERDQLWREVVLARAPFFARYEEKSGRTIPIAILVPRQVTDRTAITSRQGATDEQARARKR